MKILFKFPSRSRPEKFFAAIKNIQENISDQDNYLISVNLDYNDHTMLTHEVTKEIDSLKNVIIHWGHSRSKVDACNRNVETEQEYPWDILVLTSDDMDWIKFGFDDLIREAFKREGSLDRVMHVRDGYDHDPIVSVPILGKEWYTTYGYVYHPSYLSLFCDEELYLLAKQIDKLILSELEIVIHQHPVWTGGKVDHQLKHTQSYHAIDKITFQKRQRLNFFIK